MYSNPSGVDMKEEERVVDDNRGGVRLGEEKFRA